MPSVINYIHFKCVYQEMGETKYWGQKIPRYKTENMILILNCKTKKYGALQILGAYAKMNDAPTIFHLYFFSRYKITSVPV